MTTVDKEVTHKRMEVYRKKEGKRQSRRGSQTKIINAEKTTEGRNADR